MNLVATVPPNHAEASPAVVSRPGWSWKIGEPFGIGVYVHATFLMLFAWIAASHAMAGKTGAELVSGLLLVIAVFAIVVAHELGHALAARRFGIGTRSIVLLPIGGVASLERMPEKPGQELIVAIAGPTVNVVLAAVFGAIMLGMGHLPQLSGLSLVGGSIVQKLFFINVTLAVFNLIPAFPMDGGRVLRAALTYGMGRERATVAAAQLGQSIALVFGFIGLFQNPMLVLVALFVWMGAQQEATAVKVKSALHGVPVSSATITDYLTMSSTESLASAVDHILARAQHDFPVVDDGRLVGVLTRSDVVRALAERGIQTRVGEAMHKAFTTASPDDPLEDAMPRLVGEEGAPVMVVRGDQLLGMLTTENLAELLVFRAAAKRG
jgi:Zn-dependent protease/CBS domain-containing protein